MKENNKANRFYKNISGKMHFAAYIIIILLIAFAFNAFLFMRIVSSANLAAENLKLAGARISSSAEAAADHTMILRDTAEGYLKEPATSVPSELFSSLTVTSQGQKYELGKLPKYYDKDLASYVTGGGIIPPLHSETAQEIEASLKLNQLFADIKHNIPQASWVYYYSNNRFINMYPFENQSGRFAWTDEYLVHPLFMQAKPEQNPDREIRWFKAYIDEAGKGLMTSITAPVYDQKDKFRGMVGMDFTLQTMKSYLSAAGLDIGTPILINNQGQVLAQQSSVNYDDKTVKQLSDVIPSKLKDSSEKILNLKSGIYYDISNWKVYVLDIDYAPWRLIFLINKKQLFLNALRGMWAELLGILFFLIILGVLEQRRRLASKLRTYKAAVDSSSAPIIITDHHNIIQYVNKSFVETTGYFEGEIIGCDANILISDAVPDEVNTSLMDAFNNNKSWKGELQSKKKDGTLYWVNILISPVIGNKENGCWVAVMEDISERKHVMEALHELATLDVLTKTPNRGYFINIADNEFNRAVRYNKSLSVMMLDIDHFKHINDTYGHLAGDMVLQKFAERCSELIRSEDTIGRLGGEEFAFLLPEIDLEGARAVGERIRQSVEMMEIKAPDGRLVKITCSIGITQKEKDDDSFDILLSRADKAMYEAKHSGRNGIAVKPKNQNEDKPVDRM
ncbi:MAG: diguanylate cyclase [Bacillota bacterium]|nr:diguanylate cyclase [Bacillota bacterium]